MGCHAYPKFDMFYFISCVYFELTRPTQLIPVTTTTIPAAVVSTTPPTPVSSSSDVTALARPESQVFGSAYTGPSFTNVQAKPK